MNSTAYSLGYMEKTASKEELAHLLSMAEPGDVMASRLYLTELPYLLQKQNITDPRVLKSLLIRYGIHVGGSPVSHVGMISDKPGEIIHSARPVAGGLETVRAEHLADWNKYNDVFLLKHRKNIDRAAALAIARSLVKSAPSNTLGDKIRSLLPFQRSPKDVSKAQGLTCSQMLGGCFKGLFGKNYMHLTPYDIFRHPSLDVVAKSLALLR